MESTTSKDPPPPRVLAVALDATVDCRAMLEAAAMLAAKMGADLRGVWVQDDELRRLAGLPFVSEVAFGGERPRPLDTTRLERSLARHVNRLEKLLASSADQRHVHWELRARKGEVESTLIAESRGADLLIVGNVRRVHHIRRESGQVASRLSMASTVPVLLLPPGAYVRGPVAVLMPMEAEPGSTLVGVAIRLVRQFGGELLLLRDRHSPSYPDKLSGHLASLGIASRVVMMRDTSATTVAKTLERAGCGLLLVETPVGAAPDPALLARVNCPLLVVRTE